VKTDRICGHDGISFGNGGWNYSGDFKISTNEGPAAGHAGEFSWDKGRHRFEKKGAGVNAGGAKTRRYCSPREIGRVKIGQPNAPA
jgi:hypothetical protein